MGDLHVMGNNTGMISISCGIHPVRDRCNGLKGGKRPKFFVANDCHPQTIALVETRGSAINLDIVVSYCADSIICTVSLTSFFQPVYPNSTLDVSPKVYCCDPRLSVAYLPSMVSCHSLFNRVVPSPVCQPWLPVACCICQPCLPCHLFANH